MLTREQLLFLFDRFSSLTSQPDVKKRIADAVQDKQEAVAATTVIQEEILREMGVDPGYGIQCLGKINTVYENDQDLMIRFYKFVAKEELACDEAELDPTEFSKKKLYQERFQEQQLEMLTEMRRYHLDDQSVIIDKLCQQMENANFDGEASLLSSEQMQEIVRRKVSPLFKPGEHAENQIPCEKQKFFPCNCMEELNLKFESEGRKLLEDEDKQSIKPKVRFPEGCEKLN